MKSFCRSVLALLVAAAAGSTSMAVDYLQDVKPLLERKCYACHGTFKTQAELRVDTAAQLIQGGQSGPAVVPGKPNDSLLIDVLTGEAGFRMPPADEGSPLTDAELALFRQWIADGAIQPPNESPQADPRNWWSYRPIVRPAIPQVDETSWSRNAIDDFVAAAREEHDLPHAASASGQTWLRRVYLDLIGLPPTREELLAFLRDDSESAYEHVVDDLLSRPQYGERWGRHWMDIWRYSDWYGSRGINEIRYSQRHIWRWRDWIIQSLNADKGYDQMVREMLAADEIAGDDPAALPATGYLGRNWYKFDRDVWMFETVERTGEAFLGLTLRCCRCHDHKYDPISQEEYYRFRAFFEPHDVRTDPISALTGTQKDATLGQVPNEGIARVYDKQLDVPTYRFERGDNRYPDKTKPLSPGVPAAFGGDAVSVTAVALPAAAWYPALRPGVRETFVEQSRQALAAAESQRAKAAAAASAADERLEVAKAALANASGDARHPSSDQASVFLDEDFSRANPDVWQTVNGTWAYEQGRLVQRDVTSFATIVTRHDHPTDFQVHLRYRPLMPGTYRSVGFSFDYQDKGNSQDVYTSTGDAKQSVQAFHRVSGQQVYPPAGIVPTTLQVGQEAVLDVTVQGSRLTINLNGERKLEYVLPIERKPGAFALWVHQGSGEFLELRIRELAESMETLTQRKRDTDHAAQLAQLRVDVAAAELASVEARLAAALAEHLGDDTQRAAELAIQAARFEHHVSVLAAQLEIARLEFQLIGHQQASPPSDDSQAPAAPSEIEKKLVEAKQKLADASTAASSSDGTYSPLGEQFPQTSTGRRKSLAAWIANASNPRTARVAVNHIWGRHFGQPLAATPENFGLNGRVPSHAELLDWLASELIDEGWRMKPLHKAIVLSSTYRMASRVADCDDCLSADPENRWLWRMNARRMEAEVVRDRTLHLAGTLDLTRGGPEISESDGEKVLRRSLYFRNTPNEKMPFLEIFDVADPNACYRRKESVVPHQSLAMMNSGLAQDHARLIAEQLQRYDGNPRTDAEFVISAFETMLTRQPTDAEQERCLQFLRRRATSSNESSGERFAGGGTSRRVPSVNPAIRAREDLVHVLLLHNDFVTVR